MKVLQINSVCGIGSTGRIATDIHNALQGQGHEGYIAYGRNLPENCNNAIKIGKKYDKYVHVALTRAFDKHGFGSQKATQQFIREITEIDPDIIHLHNIHGYYINIKVLFDYLKQANKPVIWTLHDCWAFTGHCSHFDYIGCEKWQKGCYNCPQKQEYPASNLIDNSKYNYLKKNEIFTGVKNLTIVTPSKWLVGLVNKSFLKEYPVKVINNGIDLEIFQPTENDFKQKNNLEDKYLILGVANIWGEKKGYNYFLELSDKIKGDELIILVGLTEMQKRGLPQNIIGIKKTNNIKTLAEIYSAADVFVNLTLEDTFPTTNLEALACGTPVVTFNTGGSIESVNEHCGFVTQKGDLEEVIKKINIIKSGKKGNHSAVCSKYAKTFYNKNDRYHDYIEIYENMISHYH